jgi:FkbM family methyltransferase
VTAAALGLIGRYSANQDLALVLMNTVNRSVSNVIQEFRFHYSLFGIRGVLLLTIARLLRKQIKVRCSVPGFRYPVHLRLRTSDVTVFSEILLDVQYDWEFSANPKVIVDAGANIGLTAVFYANKYPHATIIAIEPEPSNFQMLKENAGSYPNIIAQRAALWNKDCDLDILDPGDGLWDFWGFRTSTPQTSPIPKRGLVRGMTMDRLMKDNGINYIDLLKLDIEGAEKEVCESPVGWIDRVGALAVELHDRFKEGCTASVFAATRVFEHRWKRGETTFIVRCQSPGRCSAEQTCSPQPYSLQLKPRLPLKIRCAA